MNDTQVVLCRRALKACIQGLDHLDHLLPKDERDEVWAFCDGTKGTPNARLILTLTKTKSGARACASAEDYKRGYQEGIRHALTVFRQNMRTAYSNADAQVMRELDLDDDNR